MRYSHLLFNIKYTIALTQCTSIDTEAERVSSGEGFNGKKKKLKKKKSTQANSDISVRQRGSKKIS